MYHGNLAASLAGLFPSIHSRVVWNIRQSLYSLNAEKPLTALLIRLGAWISSRVDQVIYNSTISLRQHSGIGYAESNSAILYNGFDTDRFHPDDVAGDYLRQSLGLEKDALLVGLMGRFHPMKDHETFFKAASRLRQDCPAVRFVLAGKGIEKTNRALFTLVEAAGVADHTCLLGEREDMPHIHAAMDIATSSSWAEGFPNVIGEAMSCGIPCVVTDVGDSAHLVGNTGMVVPARNPEALFQAWKTMIGLSRKSRLELGKAARKRIQSNFDIGVVAKRYETLYQNILAIPGTGSTG